ncbi:MAG: DUF5682 family protein [Candidatus Ozemobacteraceae bacterium]
MEECVHLFGIRHHGPGSARSLTKALEALKPDCIFVEVPQDAETVVAVAGAADIKPPVALLIYVPDEPAKAIYIPFAEFSPEWVAMRYAFEHGIKARFMDLPMSIQFCMRFEESAENNAPCGSRFSEESYRQDPFRYIAEATGFSDIERWWERMVETRIETREIFEAISLAMDVLREKENLNENPSPNDLLDRKREAFMRQTIRSGRKEGCRKIAVVCGAWHVPALRNLPPAARDSELLKGLQKIKTAATWIPWTHGRFQFSTGYRAGIQSPGWYQHLWECGKSGELTTKSSILWISKIARFLREEDLVISTAHVIETIRLAEALTTLRNHPVPGLTELMDATVSVICAGDPLVLKLIHEKLLVDEKLGSVPPDSPQVPLQKNLAALQKGLRLLPEVNKKNLDLDLRKEMDLSRSQLLHRLTILGIPWGKTVSVRGKTGTFHEIWELQWLPEFSLLLIEASVWGNTVDSAASAFIAKKSFEMNLSELARFLEISLLADLTDAINLLLERLRDESALTSDIGLMMDGLVPLAEIARYGNVRKTSIESVSLAIRTFVARICAGLISACNSMNDEASEIMFKRLIATSLALKTIDEEDLLESWNETLMNFLNLQNLNGLLSGGTCRILFDSGKLDSDNVSIHLSRIISSGENPSRTAAWIEGFLYESGQLLLLNEKLWDVVDSWVSGLSENVFMQTLPLLRRTFSRFPPAERRQIGKQVKNEKKSKTPSDFSLPLNFNFEKAGSILPLVSQILGIAESKGNSE